MPLYLVLYVAVAFRHSCLTVFAWRRVVLRFFDPKQLLRISCILWCYYSKWYSIIFENASLWSFIVTQNWVVWLNLKACKILIIKRELSEVSVWIYWKYNRNCVLVIISTMTTAARKLNMLPYPQQSALAIRPQIHSMYRNISI